MKTCIVVLLVACAVALSLAAEVPCEDLNLCPAIYDPFCAQKADGSWNYYASECQMKNCINEDGPFGATCHTYEENCDCQPDAN